MKEGSYVGEELEVFKLAKNWKAYFKDQIRPYLKGRVLEVGAGLGATAEALCDESSKEWVCMEPDRTMVMKITSKIKAGVLPSHCVVMNGTIEELSEDDKFDTIIYIDVLEHIENDKRELEMVSRSLKLNGTLIILSPAYQYLYTSFDAAIGHYRRYSKKALLKISPSNLTLKKIIYLDSIGLFTSLGNKLILKSPMPNKHQIQLWDNFLIPLSRIIDPIIFNSTGRSVFAVWHKGHGVKP